MFKSISSLLVVTLISAAPVFAAVSVSSPNNGATVTSPVNYVASATSATCAKGVAAMGIYVNNVQTYVTHTATLNYELTLPAGAQHTVVEEWDNCGGATFVTLNLTVAGTTPPPPASSDVTIVASPASIAAGGSTVLTVVAKDASAVYLSGSDGSKYTLAYDGGTKAVTPAATTIYTASATVKAEVVTAATTVTVTAAGGGGGGGGTGGGGGGVANVLTWHGDAQRSGLNADETSLTPANVNTASFGKLFSYLVDGYAYAQPLVASNITIAGALHNVLYVATEADQVYAFDADSYGTGAPLWHVSLLRAGESPLTTSEIKPYDGITSTPVIDAATGTMYVVSTQKGSGGASFRLNALDIATGAQKFGGAVTIQASVPGTNSDAVNGVDHLTTACIQRAALLLADGTVFMGFGSCHSGWLLAYDATTLTQTGAFNSSPNLNGEGEYASAGGVWMGAGGPAADGAGNIYITTGNGPWDGKTAFSDSMLKFNAKLQMEDYFTPSIYQFLDCRDGDLASGGLLLIPGTAEAVVGGKQGKLYLLNTLNPGKEQANDAGATQSLFFESKLSAPYTQSCTDSSGTHTAQIGSYQIFGTAAYFNGSIYLGVQPSVTGNLGGIGQFKYSGILTPEAYTTPGVTSNARGTTPFISANGAANGILWMIDHGQPLGSAATPTHATLRAYNAENIKDELWNSSTTASDVPGYGIKFSVPIVANGKAYISTGHELISTGAQGEIDVYGLKK